jgi:hypothetical protein
MTDTDDTQWSKNIAYYEIDISKLRCIIHPIRIVIKFLVKVLLITIMNEYRFKNERF